MASPLIIFPTSLSEPWRILAELRTILGQDHPLDLWSFLDAWMASPLIIFPTSWVRLGAFWRSSGPSEWTGPSEIWWSFWDAWMAETQSFGVGGLIYVSTKVSRTRTLDSRVPVWSCLHCADVPSVSFTESLYQISVLKEWIVSTSWYSPTVYWRIRLIIVLWGLCVLEKTDILLHIRPKLNKLVGAILSRVN